MTAYNYETWIASKVLNGKEAEISLAVLESTMYEPEIKHWIFRIAKKLGCKATVHWESDLVTFYPVSQS